MFLNIVIPTHNRASRVVEAVASCLRQRDGDFRLIVVNDGSTDNTAAALASITDPRLTVIEQANQGVSVARNRGIEAADSEWVAFLDDDDTFDESYVAAARALIERHGAAIDLFWCGVNRLYFDAGDGRLVASHPHPASADDRLLFVTRFAASHGFAARRRSLLSVGGFDPDLRQSEDLDLLLRLLAAGAGYAVIAEPRVNLHLHADASLSRSGNVKRAIDAHEKLIANNRAFLDRHPHLLAHYLYVLCGDYYRAGRQGEARRCLGELFRLRPWAAAPWQRLVKFELIRPLRRRVQGSR